MNCVNNYWQGWIDASLWIALAFGLIAIFLRGALHMCNRK